VAPPLRERLRENFQRFRVIVRMKEQKKQSIKIAPKKASKSLLEDWQSFRAWQEALYDACGKRVPVI
jgi:hypothetical protein